MLRKQEKIKKSTNHVLNGENKRDQKKRIKKQRIAQNVIRYNAMMENGICVLGDDMYSRAIRFTDINYQIAPDDRKEQIVYHYSSLLNSLGNEVDLSVVVNNRLINKEEFRKNVLMHHVGDGLDSIRIQLNNHLLENMEKGNNSIISEKMFVFSCKEKNYEDALKSLEGTAKDMESQLQNLGCETEILNGKQRLENLYSIIKPAKKCVFDYKDFNPTYTSKDVITPYSFDFKKDYFVMDDRYCCVLVLKNFPTWLSDKLISELSSIERNLLITFHMQAMSKEDALTLINQTSQKVDMQIDTENQKNLNRANFSGKLPPKLKQQEESVNAWRVAVEEDDQRIFKCQFLVMVNASSYDEMIETKKNVERVASKVNCNFIPMSLEQEIGFNSVLPLGRPKEGLGRNLLTDNCAYITPFISQQLLSDSEPVYYGNNKTTNNLILCNRKHLPNQNGFILGKSGAGKSFIIKNEITQLFMRDSNADIVIIDPQGEYKKLADEINARANKKLCDILQVNTHSNLHFNPLEGDISQSDFIPRKTEMAIMMVAEMLGNSSVLNGEQCSIVDRCITDIYREYEANLENNPLKARIPTLRTFYDKLGEFAKDNLSAKQMHNALWTYVSGSYDLFAKESNVDVNSQMVIYDISELGESIRTLGLKVILENIREQVIRNSIKGRRTWIYIDEIYRLLSDEFSENFLYEFWKWVRKFGGACTGISQDVTDILRSQKCCAMLSNSEFYILLAQDPIDLVQLQSLLSLSDEQTRFCLTAGKGQGLLRFGNTIIPFESVIDKETLLYHMWNTDANEGANKRKEYIDKLKENARLKQQAEIEKKRVLGKSVVNKVQKQEKTIISKSVEKNINVSQQVGNDSKKLAFDPNQY